jgi:hypothetical protein
MRAQSSSGAFVDRLYTRLKAIPAVESVGGIDGFFESDERRSTVFGQWRGNLRKSTRDVPSPGQP